jgi:RNA polymerase sigma-70 factor (ECF subfamily)
MLDGEDKIIANAVRGEASAFGLLYDHYQPQIYRFVMLKTGRREEAEDLTHQVFLHALEHIKNYKDLGYPFSSWLYQIARNQVIDHYRTRRDSIPLQDAEEEALAGENPETDASDKLELQKLRAAIARLKPEHQDVIILRFVEEIPIKNVAAAIGKSEGAVKLLQYRALKQLKKILSD